MADGYIRKEDAWSAVEQANGNTTWAERDDCHKRLVNLPSADVVPVARCKDCLFFTTEKSCCRPEGLTKASEDDFCSYGERREE